MLKIDFVSDVVCPWCAIGLTSLESALRELGPDFPVELHVQPFELNPQMPPEGEEVIAYVQRKSGASVEEIAERGKMIRERGAAVGFQFGERQRIVNTFDAHRLLHWAGLLPHTAGEAPTDSPQVRLKRALLTTYHRDERLPNEREVMLDAVRTAGLDVDEAAAVLDEPGRYGDEVRAAETFYQRAGINGVPAVVVNDAFLISGGQPAEVYLQALRQIAQDAQNAQRAQGSSGAANGQAAAG